MKTTTAFHCFLALMAGIFTTASGRAQSDDFADANDTGWSHYAPLDAFNAVATYTFSNGTYRITSPPSPNAAQIGPARAGAVRADVKYKTFFVSVEIKDWDPVSDTSMGLLARVQPEVGLGKTDGYAFTYQGKDTDVQISRVDDEEPFDLSGHPSVDLVPGGNYRMIFFGVGSYLEGRIYDMDNPGNPIITVSGTDAAYTEGSCGLVVFADGNTVASAAFDNYFANGGETAPPALAVEGEVLRVSWDVAAAMGRTLESSIDLTRWTAQVPHFLDQGRFNYIQEGPVTGVSQVFYRLRLGPAPVVAAE